MQMPVVQQAVLTGIAKSGTWQSDVLSYTNDKVSILKCANNTSIAGVIRCRPYNTV